MAKYKVRAQYRTYNSEQVFPTLSGALFEGNKLAQTDKDARTIVVLRDSEGLDHPDNAGKFFLYHIVK